MENSNLFGSLHFLKSFVFTSFSLLLTPAILNAQISSVQDALSAIRDGEEEVSPIPHIYFSISSTNGTSDECVIAFFEDATSDYEWTFDALKMESFNPQAIEMALVTTDQNMLSVDARPYIQSGFSVPIYLDIPSAGTFTFTIGDAINLPSLSCLYVEDVVAGSFIPVVSGQTLSIISSEPYSGNRLVLHASATLGITTQNITCGNTNNGVIDVICSGENISFSISQNESPIISLSSQSQTITGLPAGQYDLQIVHSVTQCPSQFQSLTINNPEEQSALITWQRADHCNTDGNGALLIENSGSNQINYSIFFEDGTLYSTGLLPVGPTLIQGLSGNIYQVTTDGDCGLNETVDLNDLDAIPAIGYDVMPVNCNEINSGSIVVFESPEPYNFDLVNNFGEVIFSGSAGDTVSDLAPGVYALHAYKESQVCPAVNIQVEVMTPELLIAEAAEINLPFCNESSTGSFLVVSNASSGFDFLVTDSNGVQVDNGHSETTTVSFNSLSPDVYSVDINSTCGSSQFAVDLNDPNAISAEILGGDVIINLTEGQSETLYVEQNVTNDASYHWSLSNGYESSANTFLYDFNEGGNLILRLEKNNEFCFAIDSIAIQVNLITGLNYQETIAPISFIQTADDITFSFHGDKREFSNVSIIDISGKPVWSASVFGTGNKKITASTNQFSAGTYILLCYTTNNDLLKSKFIVH